MKLLGRGDVHWCQDQMELTPIPPEHPKNSTKKYGPAPDEPKGAAFLR